MAPGSDSNLSISSSRGAVKGWCMAVCLFSVSSYSTSGNSVTQIKAFFDLSTSFNSFAIARRKCDSASATILGVSAMNTTVSPGLLPSFSNIRSSISCSKNLMIGDWSSFSWTLIQAIPFAPYVLAISVKSSKAFLDKESALFLMFNARICPPDSNTCAKTLKFVPRTISARSTISMSILMSGLSVPNRSIASWYFKIGKGVLIFSFNTSLYIAAIISSIIWKIIFSLPKDISISIWVNSGCLSCRKSSSRKHLTIWKYLSIPETMRICLNSCGDCGSA